MSKIHKGILFIVLFASTRVLAQGLAYEVGATFGPVAFQSDYGERNDFETNSGNTGFGIGAVHYINFSANSDRTTFFNDHVRLRSELSFSSTNLQHFGRWVDEGNNTPNKIKLREMRGTSKVINLGAQAEFHILSIHDFENTIGSFDPYVSLGAMYGFYINKSTSTLGPLGTLETTFPKYLVPSDGKPHGYTSESKSVLSLVSGIGTRYKLTKMSDLLFDLRFQYFNSDWVDGLNPNKSIYKENKSNDWVSWFNVGYIYYLEF